MFFVTELKEGGSIGLTRELADGYDPFRLYTFIDPMRKGYLRLDDTVYSSVVGANMKAKQPTDIITIHTYHMGTSHEDRGSHLITKLGKTESDGIKIFLYRPYDRSMQKLWPTEPRIKSFVNTISKLEIEYSAEMVINHKPWLKDYLENEVAEIETFQGLLDKFPKGKLPPAH
jgi:hypothetical protein